MEIRWLWLSFVVDPVAIIIMGIFGVWLSTRVTAKNQSAFARISEYALKAVALTAALAGINSFLSVFSAGTGGHSMILLAFGTIVLGTIIGSWSNFDERLENWINLHWNNAKSNNGSGKLTKLLVRLENSKQDKSKSFGWAAAYATYVSLVGVLSIMGPIHEATDGVLTFIIMKIVLDTVATAVFAMCWGPGVLISALFVFVWQVAWGLGAPFLSPILGHTVMAFADGVGGMIIMAMGLSVAGVLKDNKKNEEGEHKGEYKSFRTGNLFPAMILAFIVGALAVAFKIYW